VVDEGIIADVRLAEIALDMVVERPLASDWDVSPSDL